MRGKWAGLALTALWLGSPLAAAQEETAPSAESEGATESAPEAAAPPAPEPESAPPPVSPAPATTHETQETKPAASTAPQTLATVSAPDDELFGQYRVRVGMARPDFDDGLEFYDKLYGKEKWYPTFGVDWFPWDYFITAGLTMRLGFYTADGSAAKTTSGKPKDDLTADDIIKDENGPTTLTLIPLQLALATEFTPFSRKYVVIDAWIGAEQIYFQEVRSIDSSSGTKTTSSLAETKKTDDSLTNRGWKMATTAGVSANILLNWLDEQSPASMRDSMGLGYVYLSPFLEFVRTLSKDGASFGRTALGVGFTFESTR